MRKVAVVLVLLVILGTITISGCTTTEPGQNNTTMKQNNSNESANETLGGEAGEKNQQGENTETRG